MGTPLVDALSSQRAAPFAPRAVVMLGEFFAADTLKTRAWAWLGLLGIVAYSWLLAHVKLQINEFFGSFYDLLQRGDPDAGSGETGSGDATRAELRVQVWAQLFDFALIVAPLVSFSPAAKWLRSVWSLKWRLALVCVYLGEWDVEVDAIEGAAQRLHEDTQRFANALQGCLVTALDALFTLLLFVPALAALSEEVAPPFSVGTLRCVWLVLAAIGAAAVGLGGAVLAGQKLVGLEVANQQVEAELRKDLVVLELTPSALGGTEEHPHTATRLFPAVFFGPTLRRLYKNYLALFIHFGGLNAWLTFFDQCMVLAPYVCAAPLIFADDPTKRISLGVLIKVSNAFSNVFGALSVLSENWGAVNDFRSTLRRLREFEHKLQNPHGREDGGDPPQNCLLKAVSEEARSEEARPEVEHSRTEHERRFDMEL